MWSRLLHIPKKHPFIFGVSVTALKTSTVDLLIQRYGENVSFDKIDWRRTSVFCAFGVIYQGSWQYFLFVKMMPQLVPGAEAFALKSLRDKLRDVQGLKGLAIQNFIENGINNPLLFFPVFYTLKEFIEGGDLRNGIAKYRLHLREDLTAIWSVWIPAQFINFAFSPMWFRVPFVACVSAGWTAYVSLVRGSPEKLPTATEES